MDQDSVFMSNLMRYLFRKLNIKIITVTPYNHQSLKVEHGIKTLSQNTDITFIRTRPDVA